MTKAQRGICGVRRVGRSMGAEGVVRAVVFDLDGTLIRSTGVDDACFVRACEEVYGVRVGDTDWGNYEHSTDDGLAREVCERWGGRTPAGEEVERMQVRFFELLGGELARVGVGRVEGAAELLRGAGLRGARVGIATGSWRESARMKAGAGGVDLESVSVSCSGLVEGRALRRDEIIAGALERLGVARDLREWSGEEGAGVRGGVGGVGGVGGWGGVVYVGDGVWDLRATRVMGIGFVGVRHDGVEGALRDAGAREVVGGFGEGFVEAVVREAERSVGRTGGWR